MNNKTRIERLNATLYLASCVPAELIDQESWEVHCCKTRHCIGGWCAQSSWHRERGMSPFEKLGAPKYGYGVGCRAFADFHGITWEEAWEVTLENHSLSGVQAKRDVCRKLKALIHKYGGEVMYS